ncbi:murein biosynthesis integral membrane protein MurJ, partial [Pseudomonadota bacterium]|nr:murein biosynthesis integral membrane protein MurJ [Pseudomonadota bacterium]
MQEKPLTKSFSIVGIWTAISQFLGIVRDVILTSIIGPGLILDTFIVVLKITYSFKIFLSDTIPKAFIPVLSE